MISLTQVQINNVENILFWVLDSLNRQLSANGFVCVFELFGGPSIDPEDLRTRVLFDVFVGVFDSDACFPSIEFSVNVLGEYI
jgi:hypothetical protein